VKTIKIVFLVALATCFLSLTGCRPYQPVESDFNFIFKYSVQAGNELNTFKGTYTRDMVRGFDVTTRLTLTKDELDQIHQKMIDIDLFNYPDTFKVGPTADGMITMETPYDSYYFKVQAGNETKELSWDAENINPNPQADKLRELIKLIIGIIQSKPAYKALPEPRGGYM
jgi:hypothetical protein